MQEVTTVKERLTKFIEHKGLSQAKFERACELANGFVNSIGKSIRGESINKISVVFPELSRAWLLLGEGEMIKPSDTYRAQLDFINAQKLRTRGIHLQSAGRDLTSASDEGRINLGVMECDGNCEEAKRLREEVKVLNEQLHKKTNRSLNY